MLIASGAFACAVIDDVFVNPFSVSTGVGQATQFTTTTTERNCYDMQFGPYAASANQWNSFNPSVATVDFSGSSDAVGVGDTNIEGCVERTIWYNWGGGYCEPFTDLICNNSPMEVDASVANIQYKGPNNSTFADATSTLYVLKDTQVTFKAMPNPGTATFEAGKPTWSGTSGATGTGETVSVTFNTVSSNTSDFKTVIATSGNSITVNVVVISLTTQLNPEDNFTGRSLTSFGIHESVSLSFSMTPTGLTAQQVGGLQWSQNSGSGTLANPPTDGTGTYRVADSAGSAVLELKMVAGPSTGQGPTNNITVVAPSGGSVQKITGSGVRHFQNWWSCGFLGDIYIAPKNVSFFNLFFLEEDANAAASGWLGFLNGIPHCNPACTAFRIGSGDINTGARVVTSGDAIFSGKFRDVERGPYATGIVTWTIPWDYSISGNAGTFTNFFTVAQMATSVSSGKCTIQKGGSATISAELGDPTSEW